MEQVRLSTSTRSARKYLPVLRIMFDQISIRPIGVILSCSRLCVKRIKPRKVSNLLLTKILDLICRGAWVVVVERVYGQLWLTGIVVV